MQMTPTGFLRPALAGLALAFAAAGAQAGTVLVGLNAPDSSVLQFTTGGAALGTMVGPPTVQDPTSFGVDVAGNLYIGSQDNGSIIMRSTDGTFSTFKSGLSALLLLEVGPDDGVYFTRTAGGSTIERVNQNGTVDIVVSGIVAPRALAFDANGDLYYSANGNAGDIFRYNFGSGTSGLFASVGHGILDMEFDSNGNLLVVDGAFDKIDQITPTGTISLFAGVNDGTSIALDEFGAVYVSSFANGTVHKFAADGTSLGAIISGLDGPIPVGYLVDTGETPDIPAPPTLAGLLAGLALMAAARRRETARASR